MVIDMEKLKELQRDLEKLERLNDSLREIFENVELLKTALKLGLIDPKFENFVKTLEESHICNELQASSASQASCENHSKFASHTAIETQRTHASQPKVEAHVTHASRNFSEFHDMGASQNVHVTRPSFAETQPDEVIYPKTNPKCEIHVFRRDSEVLLEWWHANRKVDQVIIKDEWEIYRAMKEHAVGGILTFSKFWKIVRRISGFNHTKASLVFNYIGSKEKFNTEIKKVTSLYLNKEIKEWAIVFKPLIESEEMEEIDWKEKIKEEIKLWQDLLG